ncbi:MAG: putative aliphatic sulfonates transport permease protein SsuC [Smithella sp. PtaU1.Bin162]|nr:MAG: putative aliphatic sulfonates transport permease protein SsuC [Smithella sp. PtaU1.Bin162]
MKKEKFLLIVVLIIIWQILSFLKVFPPYKLPSPVDVVRGFCDLLIAGTPPGYLLHKHALYSLYRVLWGYGLACLLSVPLGLLMGWSKSLHTMLSTLVDIVRPIPPLAWIPIAILWFGIGIKSAAFIIFLGAFPPILLSTISGVNSINPRLIEAAKTLHAGEKDIFFKVLLPGSIPSIFTGMRIGIGIAWMTLVAAEFTGVKEGYGLGYMIMTSRDLQLPGEIIAGMLVIGVIGLIIDKGIRIAEAKIIKWN